MGPVATKPQTNTKYVQRNLKLREARNELSNLVRTVESSPVRFTIGKRGLPSAMVVSYQQVEPLFSEKIEPKIALIIVQQLLRDAPLHLSTPAVDELSKLSRNDLFQILYAIPFTKNKIRELNNNLEEPRALDRLIRRLELAKTISDAHKAGLYEAAEHQTSKVQL